MANIPFVDLTLQNIPMNKLGVLAAITITFSPPALADGDKDSSYQPMTSMEATHKLGLSSASNLNTAAEFALNDGDYNKAINLCREALEKENNDPDIHLVYARALEEKLKDQENRDPYIYKTCVKEWLMVFRNESGDENNIGWHGLALPAMTYLYQDEGRVIMARNHLVKLTGRAPKPWETDSRFLAKVLKSDESKLRGKVVKKR